jgi:hypothetical protein
MRQGDPQQQQSTGTIMKMTTLGATGLQVSTICLGTMTFGEQNTEAEAHSQLDYALDRGINFIDTAEMYPVMPRRKSRNCSSISCVPNTSCRSMASCVS